MSAALNTIRLALIWAEAEGGIIGRDGVMPWHVPEDLAHFKSITHGSPVVMGRKTWESLPPRFRPLSGRENIVVTRNSEWSPDAGSEVAVAHSIDAALALAAASRTSLDTGAGTNSDHNASHEADTEPWVWVIGGAEIFAAVIGRASRLEVTELRATISGDTVAPTIGAEWQLVRSTPGEGWLHSRGGLDYRFFCYER